MLKLSRIARISAALGTSALAVSLAAGPAGAAPGATFSSSAAGVNIQCLIDNAPVTFTTTGGTLHEVNQMHQDATGTYHFTGTLSLQNVSATDGTTSTSYQIVGSSWYGGSGISPETATVRSTDEFNVIGPQGKVADVHAALTFYPDGSVKGVALGDCAPPA